MHIYEGGMSWSRNLREVWVATLVLIAMCSSYSQLSYFNSTISYITLATELFTRSSSQASCFTSLIDMNFVSDPWHESVDWPQKCREGVIGDGGGQRTFDNFANNLVPLGFTSLIWTWWLTPGHEWLRAHSCWTALPNIPVFTLT